MRRMSVFFIFNMIMSISIIAGDFTYEGYIRAGYQDQENGGDHTGDTAIGGKLTLEYKEADQFAVRATLYGSFALTDPENTGVGFYGSDDESYLSLGELYLRTRLSETVITVGRQSVDTPFANSDDIGMVPNSFEGVVVESREIAQNTLILSFLNKWSGVDSDAPEKFTRLNGDKGLWSIGDIYEGIEDTRIEGWYYHMEGLARVGYLEAQRSWKMGDFGFTLGAQYAHQDIAEGSVSRIYGIHLETGYEPYGIGLNIAYNALNGAGADNFFGGGPFFTSSEHITLADGGVDAKALLLSGCLDAAKILGIDDLSLTLNHLSVERKALDSITETDLIAEYELSGDIAVRVVYSDIDDRSMSEESFSNLRFFVDYSF